MLLNLISHSLQFWNRIPLASIINLSKSSTLHAVQLESSICSFTEVNWMIDDSLWSSDVIYWHHKSGSTLEQVPVMAWCHRAPSHYPDPMLTYHWDSQEAISHIFSTDPCTIPLQNIFENKQQCLLPGANELTCQSRYFIDGFWRREINCHPMARGEHVYAINLQNANACQ